MGFQHIEVLRYNEIKRSLVLLQNREYLLFGKAQLLLKSE